MSPQGWHTSTSNTIINNIWQHVAVVYDGSAIKLYHNGIVVKNTTLISSVNQPDSIVIGGISNNDRQLFGGIDEVRIYNRALSTDEIKTLYLNDLYNSQK